MAWSREEKEFLINHYNNGTYKEMAIALDKKESTIRVMAKRLGLTKRDNCVEAGKKKCSKCGFIYPANTDHFSKDISKSDGLHCHCKDCQREYRFVKKAGTKKCNKCELVKSKLQFQVRKNNKDGLDTICKECRNHYQNNYYKKSIYDRDNRKSEHIKKYGW